jgi:hypothetical protein
MSLSVTFLRPDMVIDSGGTTLSQTTSQAPLPTYDYISPTVMSSTKSISSFGGIISYIALVILAILLFKGAYPLLFVTEVTFI